jgi:hypothetical protein
LNDLTILAGGSDHVHGGWFEIFFCHSRQEAAIIVTFTKITQGSPAAHLHLANRRLASGDTVKGVSWLSGVNSPANLFADDIHFDIHDMRFPMVKSGRDG